MSCDLPRPEAVRRIKAMAGRMRGKALAMALEAGGKATHLGGGLSLIDITATLYGAVMRYNLSDPLDPDRDRFILSKGHGVLGYYTALGDVGFLSEDDLRSFEQTGSFLLGHPTINRRHGIEFSNGSLGMGLSLGIGVALAARKRQRPTRIFVALGDGECDEGSVWEAVMAAPHFKLGNLTAIIDRNGLQQTGSGAAIMDLGDMAEKWRSFGWDTVEVDGHDVEQLYDALSAPRSQERPRAVVAHTIKGKGAPFAENNNDWHHAILTQSQYDAALAAAAAG